MYKYEDVVSFYLRLVDILKSGKVNPHALLEEISLSAGKDNFAYIDNRRDAKAKYGYDFWGQIRDNFEDEEQFINSLKGVLENRLLYSKSEQFPDFLFKVRKHAGKLICGSLLELKSSKSGTIASFNSTLPTKCKSLDDINLINGKILVSRIASIIDEELGSDKLYRTFDRRCFYLIRTHTNNDDKVKISVVDGKFFETIPKDHLIYQMFLNVLHRHLNEKRIEISPNKLNEVEKALSFITDQTIISSSQLIEKASIRPRLRIMAEVHPEGNPHSIFYPQISAKSANLIISASSIDEEFINEVSRRIPDISVFTVNHKRNGEHIVFQYNL